MGQIVLKMHSVEGGLFIVLKMRSIEGGLFMFQIVLKCTNFKMSLKRALSRIIKNY